MGSQNDDIEQAFRTQKPSIVISVGIRSYTIAFGPEQGFSRQVDSLLKKKRLVRRRLVSQEDCERLLQPAAPSVAYGEDTCAICCIEFFETASMPVVRLPRCGHTFHSACVQQLA